MIQKVRLEHAHRLLLTEMPITEVALQCGYTDHSAFTRQFKALTGFTPRQYRQATGHEQPSALD
jgi:AraC-like DNA-binding protein